MFQYLLVLFFLINLSYIFGQAPSSAPTSYPTYTTGEGNYNLYSTITFNVGYLIKSVDYTVESASEELKSYFATLTCNNFKISSKYCSADNVVLTLPQEFPSSSSGTSLGATVKTIVNYADFVNGYSSEKKMINAFNANFDESISQPNYSTNLMNDLLAIDSTAFANSEYGSSDVMKTTIYDPLKPKEDEGEDSKWMYWVPCLIAVIFVFLIAFVANSEAVIKFITCKFGKKD